jgi:hypothetical protein
VSEHPTGLRFHCTTSFAAWSKAVFGLLRRSNMAEGTHSSEEDIRAQAIASLIDDLEEKLATAQDAAAQNRLLLEKAQLRKELGIQDPDELGEESELWKRLLSKWESEVLRIESDLEKLKHYQRVWRAAPISFRPESYSASSSRSPGE